MKLVSAAKRGLILALVGLVAAGKRRQRGQLPGHPQYHHACHALAIAAGKPRNLRGALGDGHYQGKRPILHRDQVAGPRRRACAGDVESSGTAGSMQRA